MSDFGRFRLGTDDGGGKVWMWVVPERLTARTEVHFIQIFEWEEVVGERDAAEVGSKYGMDASVVFPSLCSTGLWQSAADFSDIRGEFVSLHDGGLLDEAAFLMSVALYQHGACLQLLTDNGNNYRHLLRDAARASRDAAGTDAPLRRRVNRLGQTGEEFLRGASAPAVGRSLAEGGKAAVEAEGIAKMGAIGDFSWPLDPTDTQFIAAEKAVREHLHG